MIDVFRRLGHSRLSIAFEVYGLLIPGSHSVVGDMYQELVIPIAHEIDQKA